MTKTEFAKEIFNYLRPDGGCNEYSLFYNRWNRSKKLHERIKQDNFNAWLLGCYYCGFLSLDTFRDMTPISGGDREFDLAFAKELLYKNKFTYRQMDEIRQLVQVAKSAPTWQSLKTKVKG
jgi:hypothetical protein